MGDAGTINQNTPEQGTWVRKWWSSEPKASPSRTPLWGRRNAFRWKLDPGGPVQATLASGAAPEIALRLHDLSAGGFSCEVPLPAVTLAPGQRVKVRLQLDLDGPVEMQTEAVFIQENWTPRLLRIGRFRFTEGLTEDHRDSIHEFVLKAQFEDMRHIRLTDVI